MDIMIKHNRALMFIGPTGTGKSVYVKDNLMNRLDKERYVPLVVNFSAQTSAGQTQVTNNHYIITLYPFVFLGYHYVKTRQTTQRCVWSFYGKEKCYIC